MYELFLSNLKKSFVNFIFYINRQEIHKLIVNFAHDLHLRKYFSLSVLDVYVLHCVFVPIEKNVSDRKTVESK